MCVIHDDTIGPSLCCRRGDVWVGLETWREFPGTFPCLELTTSILCLQLGVSLLTTGHAPGFIISLITMEVLECFTIFVTCCVLSYYFVVDVSTLYFF